MCGLFEGAEYSRIYGIAVREIILFDPIIINSFEMTEAFTAGVRSLLNNSGQDGRGLSVCWNPDC